MNQSELITALRKYVEDRGGPSRDDDGNVVLPNGAWALMRRAADVLEREALDPVRQMAHADLAYAYQQGVDKSDSLVSSFRRRACRAEDALAAATIEVNNLRSRVLDLERERDDLAAEADALHAAAEGWRKRAEEAEATLDARSAGYEESVEAARSEIRRQALEEAAQAVERCAAIQGRAECCGRGHTSPPECCGDPLYLIADRDAASAIRALADKSAAGGAND